MAYDEKLADRIRAVLSDRMDLEERKMFGGLAFLIRGKMCCGIVGSDLMVRVGPEDCPRALAEKHVRPMDFTGHPSKTMVYVEADGVRTAKSLRHWIERGLRFAETLPR
jgi:TfoX/Sxy family transcriptional regulator of competence genes